MTTVAVYLTLKSDKSERDLSRMFSRGSQSGLESCVGFFGGLLQLLDTAQVLRGRK